MALLRDPEIHSFSSRICIRSGLCHVSRADDGMPENLCSLARTTCARFGAERGILRRRAGRGVLGFQAGGGDAPRLCRHWCPAAAGRLAGTCGSRPRTAPSRALPAERQPRQALKANKQNRHCHCKGLAGSSKPVWLWFLEVLNCL